jgi:hypothetical protein
MYAYEIELDVVQPHIAIPQYELFKNKHVRVLFIADDTQPEKLETESVPLQSEGYARNLAEIESILGSINLDLSDFKFDREQANER